jgi:hypothetical protein
MAVSHLNDRSPDQHQVWLIDSIIENTAPNNFSVFTCLFFATYTYLPSPLPSKSLIHSFHYSGFQPSWHNILLMAELTEH